jgi:hypothetical protein
MLLALLLALALPQGSFAQDNDGSVTLGSGRDRKHPGNRPGNRPGNDNANKKDDGSVYLGDGRPDRRGRGRHRDRSPFHDYRGYRDGWGGHGRRGDRNPWLWNRPGLGSPKYYSRHDTRTWPQASINFTWGLYGQYSRWRDNPGRGYSDSRIGALFSYVDQNVAIRLSARSNPTPKQIEYETLVLINDYVNQNVETIAVSTDGSYYVMFRSVKEGEGDWVPTEVTEAEVEKAARDSDQYGGVN